MGSIEGVVGRIEMVVDMVSRCMHPVGLDRTEGKAGSRSRTVGGIGS